MRKLCLVLALSLIPAGSYAATGDEPSPGLSPTSTRTVTGTEIVNYRNGPVPVDLSTTTIAVFVPNGSGGYKVLNGTGTSDGTFTILDVPTGFYLLQIGSNYVWTSNDAVNADSVADYRSDVVAADSSTSITFDLTNLNSWQPTDFFEMVCPNNLSFEYYFPTTGETTFTGTFPYNSFIIANLSVASEGDQYYVAQLMTQNLGSYPFTALGRYIAPSKFTQAQGSDTPIDGALETIAQGNEFEANINGADLAAQALAANPGAVLEGTGIALDVYPGSFAKGQNTDTSDLVIYGGSPLITTNGDLGRVLYGNPYPSQWPLFVGYSWFAETNYLAPGAKNSAPLLTIVYDQTLTLPTSTSPMKPLAGVVSTPTVNGKNFFGNLSGVGTAPRLEWSPPTVGTANNYSVEIYQLSNSAGNTVINPIAALYTQNTSLAVPDGLLNAGQSYVFEIASEYIPGVNLAKTPFMKGSTYAAAEVISGTMRP
jgi:hypothetical protein